MIGSMIVFKIDLRSSYHQIRMCKYNNKKTTFKIKNNHFKWLVMPIGLYVFHDACVMIVYWQHHVTCFDFIMIFSKSHSAYKGHLQ